MSDDPFAVEDVSHEEQPQTTEDPFGNQDQIGADSYGFAQPQSQPQQTPLSPQQQQPSAGSFGGDDPFASASSENVDNSNITSSDAFGLGASEAKQESNEETPLSKWQKQRREQLEAQKRTSEENKRKLLETAKAEYGKFMAQREENIQKTMAANRLEEQNAKKEFNALMQSGGMWEKVGKLTNLQSKANEDRRVARMRKLLIQLKNKNDRAE